MPLRFCEIWMGTQLTALCKHTGLVKLTVSHIATMNPVMLDEGYTDEAEARSGFVYFSVVFPPLVRLWFA